MVTRSMALLSLEIRRETNSRSSWEREAILPLHDIYIGQKAMYELEGGADFRNLSFHFLMRSLNLYAGDTVKLKPGQTKVVPMCLDTHAIKRDMNCH